MALIQFYRKGLSPFLQPRCRYYPTCSHFMLNAVYQHGPYRGIYLGMKRILRCHPFHPGGYDPVPSCNQSKTKKRIE